jgi:hypothetical protein
MKRSNKPYSEYQFVCTRSRQGNKAKLVDWDVVTQKFNEAIHKATSIKLGVAYAVVTDFGDEFEGVLIFLREGVYEFRDYEGVYHHAQVGKCKLRRVEV